MTVTYPIKGGRRFDPFTTVQTLQNWDNGGSIPVPVWLLLPPFESGGEQRLEQRGRDEGLDDGGDDE